MRKKFYFLFSFIICLDYSCKQDREQDLQYDRTKIAILHHPAILSNWTPPHSTSTTINQQDLYVIDSLLNDFVSNSNKEEFNKKKILGNLAYKDTTKYYINLKNYRRQYFAYLDSNQTKNIIVSCFCNNPQNKPLTPVQSLAANDSTFWKTYLIIVEGVWNCYFRLKFNLKTKTYDWF